MARPPFLRSMHTFRGLAILFIVAGHSVYAFDWSQSPGLMRVLQLLAGNGSVLFVFIAGYLFQHMSSEFDYTRYLGRKLRVVILPYVIMSVPAIVLLMALQPEGRLDASFYERPAWIQVAVFLLTGCALVPFWFIPMIAVYYALAPVLLWLVRQRWLYLLLPVLIAVSLVVPKRTSDIPVVTVHFLSVYLLGMCCCRERPLVMSILTRLHVPLVVALGAVVAAQVAAPPPAWGALALAQKLILSGLLMLWLDRLQPLVEGTAPGRAMASLAEFSFGVFFVHYYVIKALEMGMGTLRPGGLLGNLPAWFVVVVLTAFVSCAIIAVGRKVLGRWSRMVIGS